MTKKQKPKPVAKKADPRKDLQEQIKRNEFLAETLLERGLTETSTTIRILRNDIARGKAAKTDAEIDLALLYLRNN